MDLARALETVVRDTSCVSGPAEETVQGQGRDPLVSTAVVYQTLRQRAHADAVTRIPWPRAVPSFEPLPLSPPSNGFTPAAALFLMRCAPGRGLCVAVSAFSESSAGACSGDSRGHGPTRLEAARSLGWSRSPGRAARPCAGLDRTGGAAPASLRLLAAEEQWDGPSLRLCFQ